MVIGEPILKTGATQIFGDGKNRVNFVAVDDVAAVAVQTLDDPDAIGASVDIFGPENLSLLDVAAVFERIKGGAVRKRFLPVTVMRILSGIVKPFNPVFARQVAAGALMATVPQTVDPSASRSKWNVATTRLEDWARERYARDS
jgi:nucleoside-diphosphate-sugar epimerase